jgi:hypothetical protein
MLALSNGPDPTEQVPPILSREQIQFPERRSLYITRQWTKYKKLSNSGEISWLTEKLLALEDSPWN